jgi:hypothetical protein
MDKFNKLVYATAKQLKKSHREPYVWFKQKIFPIAIIGIIPTFVIQFFGVIYIGAKFKIMLSILLDDSLFSFIFAICGSSLIYLMLFTASVYSSNTLKKLNADISTKIRETNQNYLSNLALKIITNINLFFNDWTVFLYLIFIIAYTFSGKPIFYIYKLIFLKQQITEISFFISFLLYITIASIIKMSVQRVTKYILNKNQLNEIPSKYLFKYISLYFFQFLIWASFVLDDPDQLTNPYIKWTTLFGIPLVFTFMLSSNFKKASNEHTAQNKNFSLYFHALYLFFPGILSLVYIVKLTGWIADHEIQVTRNQTVIHTHQTLVLDRVNYFVAYDPVEKYSKVYQKSQYDWKPDRSAKTTESKSTEK